MNPGFHVECLECVPGCATRLSKVFQLWWRKAESQKHALGMKFEFFEPRTNVDSELHTGLVKKSRNGVADERSQSVASLHADVVVKKRRELPIKGFHDALHQGSPSQGPPASISGQVDDKSVSLKASQKYINDGQRQNLQVQLQNKTQTSARSDKSVKSERSQRIIRELHMQLETVRSELQSHLQRRLRAIRSDRSIKSARSDAPPRIIEDLQSQMQSLQFQLQKSMCVQIRGANDEVQILLRELSLPLEYDQIFSDEGIEFWDDLQNYTESDLVELGCRRGHAKRLLRATVGASTAKLGADQADLQNTKNVL